MTRGTSPPLRAATAGAVIFRAEFAVISAHLHRPGHTRLPAVLKAYWRLPAAHQRSAVRAPAGEPECARGRAYLRELRDPGRRTGPRPPRLRRPAVVGHTGLADG